MCEDADDRLWRYGELRRSGLSRSTIKANVDVGLLLHLRRDVYASRGVCDARQQAAMHGGDLTCVSAAIHLGLWTLEDKDPHVWVRGRGHARQHARCACVTHWATDESAAFLASPSLVQVLHQIYRCRGPEAFFVSLESALRQRLLTGQNRAQLRELLDDRGRDLLGFARQDADSGLESLVRLRLRPLGYRVRTQVSIPTVGRADLLVEERVLIEVDGRLGHADPASRHKDLVRDASAIVRGLRTVRCNYAMVLHDWDLVERAITAAVNS